MYDYILFDLDGTLTNPKEGITKCIQYALSYMGIEEPDLNNLTRFIGPPLHTAFMEYYGFDEAAAWTAVKRYRERFGTIGVYENEVFQGISDLLGQLKQNSMILAVATSKPEIFMSKILEKYDLKKYFDVAAGSELDGMRTEKADVIEEVLRRLSISDKERSRVIMVGDRKYDIEGAKACGIHSVGVEFGFAEENELESAGADYVVSSVDELRKLLLNN